MNEKEFKCKYKPTERAGLYLLIFVILLNVVCFNKNYQIQEIHDKCERIEAKIDSLCIVFEKQSIIEEK